MNVLSYKSSHPAEVSSRHKRFIDKNDIEEFPKSSINSDVDSDASTHTVTVEEDITAHSQNKDGGSDIQENIKNKKRDEGQEIGLKTSKQKQRSEHKSSRKGSAVVDDPVGDYKKRVESKYNLTITNNKSTPSSESISIDKSMEANCANPADCKDAASKNTTMDSSDKRKRSNPEHSPMESINNSKNIPVEASEKTIVAKEVSEIFQKTSKKSEEPELDNKSDDGAPTPRTPWKKKKRKRDSKGVDEQVNIGVKRKKSVERLPPEKVNNPITDKNSISKNSEHKSVERPLSESFNTQVIDEVIKSDCGQNQTEKSPSEPVTGEETEKDSEQKQGEKSSSEPVKKLVTEKNIKNDSEQKYIDESSSQPVNKHVMDNNFIRKNLEPKHIDHKSPKDKKEEKSPLEAENKPAKYKDFMIESPKHKTEKRAPSSTVDDTSKKRRKTENMPSKQTSNVENRRRSTSDNISENSDDDIVIIFDGVSAKNRKGIPENIKQKRNSETTKPVQNKKESRLLKIRNNVVDARSALTCLLRNLPDSPLDTEEQALQALKSTLLIQCQNKEVEGYYNMAIMECTKKMRALKELSNIIVKSKKSLYPCILSPKSKMADDTDASKHHHLAGKTVFEPSSWLDIRLMLGLQEGASVLDIRKAYINVSKIFQSPLAYRLSFCVKAASTLNAAWSLHQEYLKAINDRKVEMEERLKQNIVEMERILLPNLSDWEVLGYENNILKVNRPTVDQLKKQFHSKLLLVHPDKMPENYIKKATEASQKIQASFKVLQLQCDQRGAKDVFASSSDKHETGQECTHNMYASRVNKHRFSQPKWNGTNVPYTYGYVDTSGMSGVHLNKAPGKVPMGPRGAYVRPSSSNSKQQTKNASFHNSNFNSIHPHATPITSVNTIAIMTSVFAFPQGNKWKLFLPVFPKRKLGSTRMKGIQCRITFWHGQSNSNPEMIQSEMLSFSDFQFIAQPSENFQIIMQSKLRKQLLESSDTGFYWLTSTTNVSGWINQWCSLNVNLQLEETSINSEILISAVFSFQFTPTVMNNTNFVHANIDNSEVG
eukprot:GHVL01009969.1.p1 GENE.GHVL01009969.1~~GHVL01009969.1.p1  ORF type:complete len:1052 (+),score=212.23 GHVL01009969.1:412-3567(+)